MSKKRKKGQKAKEARKASQPQQQQQRPAAPSAPSPAKPVPRPEPAPAPVAAAAPPAAAPVTPAAAPAHAPVAEARTHKRLPFEVQLDIVSDHNFYAGLTLNVSEGGVFVATHVLHPVGTRLEIRLVFPGDEEPTSIMTEVRWTRLQRDADDSSPGMGLRFVDLPQAVLDKIGRFAKHRPPLYYEDD